jgi:hypothetical protein
MKSRAFTVFRKSSASLLSPVDAAAYLPQAPYQAMPSSFQPRDHLSLSDKNSTEQHLLFCALGNTYLFCFLFL